ncbi:30S ribosomal protein S2 [bacterium]|nr:30S ribosomal protein S2 [bacterium]
MTTMSMRELLEVGVHFGHQTKRWNPKMARYIFGEKNGIYIIDLSKTVESLKKACEFVTETASKGEWLLFVGTKKQAQEAIESEATRCGMFYINRRWLGGTLTNFQTIRRSIDRLKEIKRMDAEGTFDLLPKKEVIHLRRERERLEKNLIGIEGMDGLPGALFVVDTKKERIAVSEAKALGIPVVALIDTNCDPDEVQFCIPGNDDAIKAIKLLCAQIADAVLYGKEKLNAGKEPEKEKVSEVEEEATQETRVEKKVVTEEKGEKKSVKGPGKVRKVKKEGKEEKKSE